MPLEQAEGEGLNRIPNLELAQALFTVQSTHATKQAQDEAKALLDKEMSEHNMAPYYKRVCENLKVPVDENKLKNMEEENKTKLQELDEKIKDAEENLGETEIRDAYLERAEYSVLIGDKESSQTHLRQAFEKTTTLGHKLDNIFLQIRVGLFFLDDDIINRNIEKATTLIEEGGDWDRRNRLKVYKGYYALTTRDFKSAATNFLESIATFTSYELMSYKKLVEYTILTSIISLKRAELGTKVIKGAEILECLHQMPSLKKYLHSLYECQYGEFFQSLMDIEKILLDDRLLSRHCVYYVRQMRVMAYSQLLESYRSLTLQYMADAFGVSVGFIDKELSRFIAAGKLNCKIDKVGGIVETNRPDSKNYQYQTVIKQGDALLNRIQKLSRVINL